MIGERTKVLFKVWGTGAADRCKAMTTMESYCSQMGRCFPYGFDVTHGGLVLPAGELETLAEAISLEMEELTGDRAAAMRSLYDFVRWLIVEGKSGVDYRVLIEQLKEMSQYSFKESYSDFLGTFGIAEDQLINYAMRPDISYFASTSAAMDSWNDLTEKLLNGQAVVMRNANELFRLFYQEVFENGNVVGDLDGNTAPIKALSAVTGVTTRAKGHDQRVLINYKLSHIYARPNNPLMFSGVYNFAFTPTFIDAFTEETQGGFSFRFRHVFREFAHQRFGEIYALFKQFVADHDIEHHIDLFNPPGFTPSQISRFRQMAHADWSPIFEIPD